MQGFEEHVDTVDEWVLLSKKWATSATVLHSQGLGAQGWSLAGFACECLLKAVAMRKLRLNAWPTRDACKAKGLTALYSHDLKTIAQVAGLLIDPADEIAPHWAVVTQWSRFHMYAKGEGPSERVISDLFEASMGQDGVLAWLWKQL